MNLPNKLSVARLILTVIFLLVLFLQPPAWQTIALIVFAIASLTDYFDGLIARRDNLITNFGILLDPVADKVLTCSAFIAFIELDAIAAWMVVVIVSRELAITGLRLLASSKNITLAAEKLGKQKTVSQIVAILAVLTSWSYPTWGNWGTAIFGAWGPTFTAISIWIAVILTFVSGASYLWKNRGIYLNDM